MVNNKVIYTALLLNSLALNLKILIIY